MNSPRVDAADDSDLGFYIIRGTRESVALGGLSACQRAQSSPALATWVVEFDPATPEQEDSGGEERTPAPGLAVNAATSLDALSVRALLPGLQRVLDTHDFPVDGPIRPLSWLQSEVECVVQMRLQPRYRRLATVLPQRKGSVNPWEGMVRARPVVAVG